MTVGDCPDSALGAISVECTYPDGRVYVDPDAGPFTLWHGIGHVFDFERLTPGKRVWFARAFHIHGSWFGDDSVDDDAQPTEESGEAFADEYAACAMSIRAVVDDMPPKRHERICAAIRRIGSGVVG